MNSLHSPIQKTERPSMRLHAVRASIRGSAIVASLLTISIIVFVAISVLRTTLPRYHVSYQTASWQEARLAAEAGVDLAMERLNKNIPNPTASTVDWTGWKANVSTAATGPMLAKSNSAAVTGMTASGNALIASPPIYLDSANVSPVGIVAATDIELRAMYPTPAAYANNCWFRIRSMGTAAVSGPKRAPIDRMDASLRRLSLRSPMRATLSSNDVLGSTTVPFPNASRIIEVIVKPVVGWDNAIQTDQGMILGNSNNWEVDSFDSSDPSKSGTGGVYPAGDNSKIQDNGDIASNKKNPPATPYGPLIDANGAEVKGNVKTNGGDIPSTTTHENVSGANGIDPDRIFDDFDEALVPPIVPTISSYQITPAAGNPFAASGSSATTNNYHVSSLSSFTVSGTGKIAIYVDGDLNLGNGAITVPQNAYLTIYIKGNIYFDNGKVNMNNASSRTAPNLLIYGVPDPDPVTGLLPARELKAHGNPEIAAAFFGPSYVVELSGTAEWYGAVAANSFSINGGGNGGFHYDEALANSGDIKKFVIATYFEDSRQ